MSDAAKNEVLSLVANLAAVVRVQNGNRHSDTNSLLAHASQFLSDAAIIRQRDGLLEALQDLMEYYSGAPYPAIERAKAAIAKVKGDV
jgi:hypothetical protein